MPIKGITTLAEEAPAPAGGLLAQLLDNIAQAEVERLAEAAAATERESILSAHAVALCRAAGVTPQEFTHDWSASADGRLLGFVLTPAGFAWCLGFDEAGTPQIGRQAPLVTIELAGDGAYTYRLYPQRAPQTPAEGITRTVERTAPVITSDFDQAAAWLHTELTRPANFWSRAQLAEIARRRTVWAHRIRWQWYGCEHVEDDHANQETH